MLLNIFLIFIGFTVLLLRENLVDYAEKILNKNRKPVDRKILLTRVLIAGSFAVIIGISRLVFMP